MNHGKLQAHNYIKVFYANYSLINPMSINLSALSSSVTV